MSAERVDVATAQAMTRAGDTVIDVRSPEEFAAGHIVGAVNVPLDTLPAGADGIEGQLLTACSMGGRAARAAEILTAAGRSALVIDGGTKAWARAGLPIDGHVAP